MPKANLAIILLAAALLFVLGGCGGGSQSSTAFDLSGRWQFATVPGTSGTVSLTQQGTQITGALSAPGYTETQITGTLNGTALEATITGIYGPFACGEGVVRADITINLTGTASQNAMSGSFVFLPTTCLSGGSGNWSATRS